MKRRGGAGRALSASAALAGRRRDHHVDDDDDENIAVPTQLGSGAVGRARDGKEERRERRGSTNGQPSARPWRRGDDDGNAKKPTSQRTRTDQGSESCRASCTDARQPAWPRAMGGCSADASQLLRRLSQQQCINAEVQCNAVQCRSLPRRLQCAVGRQVSVSSRGSQDWMVAAGWQHQRRSGKPGKAHAPLAAHSSHGRRPVDAAVGNLAHSHAALLAEGLR